MLLGDLIGPTTRLYAKSEWAPAGPLWPALSFSQRGVANRFSSIYTRGADLVITVGTAQSKGYARPGTSPTTSLVGRCRAEYHCEHSRASRPRICSEHSKRIPDPMEIVDAHRSLLDVVRWLPGSKNGLGGNLSKVRQSDDTGDQLVHDSDRATLFVLTLIPLKIPPYIERRLHRVPDDVFCRIENLRVSSTTSWGLWRAREQSEAELPGAPIPELLGPI